jgi:hypothetical protein
MFIQHKQLKSLNVPAEKIDRIHAASSSVQLAFADYSPQLCQAYIFQISGGGKVLVVVAFYLTDSECSIFFVPKFGELPADDVEEVYEEGFAFVESMGFVLTETDYHLLSPEKKQLFWNGLSICQPAKNQQDERSPESLIADEKLKKLKLKSQKSLGRFFASL